MEQSGRNRLQPVAYRLAPITAQTSHSQPSATLRNGPSLDGKEGVDGSSPSEGFASAFDHGPFTPSWPEYRAPHFRIAALRAVMPPLVEEDGIRFVSTSGPFNVGSGKSGTPLSRTHWANLRRVVNCWGVTLGPVNPGGSRVLHALMARLNAGLLGSSDEPFTTPSIVYEPDALGSGNPLTPLRRMHSANFAAFSRRAATPLPVPVPAGALPQPATIVAIKTRTAKGQSALIMASPDRRC